MRRGFEDIFLICRYECEEICQRINDGKVVRGDSFSVVMICDRTLSSRCSRSGSRFDQIREIGCFLIRPMKDFIR